MAVLEYGNKSEVVRNIPNWEQKDNSHQFRIEILTIEEEEGGYSTIALNLPGAGSCGVTKMESIENAKEAIKAVLETYKETGEAILWAEVTADMIGEGEYKVLWIHA